MKTRMLTSIRTEIIHLNGAGERVPLCNLISELTFEQEIDMDSTENRNKLWDCIDRLAPEDRDLINRVIFATSAAAAMTSSRSCLAWMTPLC